MKRTPVVAGQFYPGTAGALKKNIAQLVDEEAAKEEVLGMYVPHAGYMASGRVAGATFSRVALPPTCIIMGPTHTGRGKRFSVMTEGLWQTPLGDMEIDRELAEKLVELSDLLEKDEDAHRLEHAVEVQLPFIQYFRPDCRFVPVVLGHADVDTYRQIGDAVVSALQALNRQAILIASGDMTHYESQEQASRKDRIAIDAMLSLDETKLLRSVQEHRITMCGYAPAAVMLSAAKKLGATNAELVKYQTSGDVLGDYSSVVGYAGILVKGMSPVVKLARDTVETYVTSGVRRTPLSGEVTPEMEKRAGVFVSIKKQGELRGCIGTFEPTAKNIAGEIVSNAIAAATRDPRFSPIGASELSLLSYSVDVLTTPEPVEDVSRLDPKKYGVIVESGYRKGLLLPDLEGVDSAELQINICRQKAGIAPDEPVKLYRFEVKRYK